MWGFASFSSVSPGTTGHWLKILQGGSSVGRKRSRFPRGLGWGLQLKWKCRWFAAVQKQTCFFPNTDIPGVLPTLFEIQGNWIFIAPRSLIQTEMESQIVSKCFQLSCAQLHQPILSFFIPGCDQTGLRRAFIRSDKFDAVP